MDTNSIDPALDNLRAGIISDAKLIDIATRSKRGMAIPVHTVVAAALGIGIVYVCRRMGFEIREIYLVAVYVAVHLTVAAKLRLG